MKKITLSLCLLAAATLAQAQVTIHAPWVRSTVPMQQASGAFMQLSADKTTRLVAAQSPVAKVVELHEMVMDNNVMKMRALPRLEVEAGKVLELKPGSYHVMLIDLKAELKEGDSVPITLIFDDGTKASVSALVRKLPMTMPAAKP